MRKKLLYLAVSEVSEKRPSGVAKKILNQSSVFEKYFDVVLLSYGDKGIDIRNGQNKQTILYSNRHRKYQIYNIARRLIRDDTFECVYIRYPRSEGSFVHLLSNMYKAGSKIVIEIPTYPYNIEKPQGNYIKETILRILDKHYRKRLKRYVHYIATYSDDQEIWGIKTINTINGIVFANNPIRKCVSHDSISLVSCAYYYDCHGCERIIEGLNHYYSKGGIENIVFHIVGEGQTIKYYKELTEKYNLCDHVIFHGFCTGDELVRIYDNADIGINSLAIHRLGLKKESTLKTKEYAAKGLPIVSSYAVDAFSESNNEKYVCMVPANDEPVDIQKIVEFYYSVYRIDENEIAREIRKASMDVCDMSVTLKPIIDVFNE